MLPHSKSGLNAPFKETIFLYISGDVHKHFGATSTIFFMETEHRYTSFLSGPKLLFCSLPLVLTTVVTGRVSAVNTIRCPAI